MITFSSVCFAPDGSGTKESMDAAIRFLYTGTLTVGQPGSPYHFRLNDMGRLEQLYKIALDWGCAELRERVLRSLCIAACSGWVASDAQAISLISKTAGFGDGDGAPFWGMYLLGMAVLILGGKTTDLDRARAFRDALQCHGVPLNSV